MTVSIPSSQAAILQAEQVSKSFSGVLALRGVDLRIHAGEVHALLGENGAGKSTLVKVVSGALRPDHGRITFRDEPFLPRDPDDSSRLGVGVVFQELPLLPDMTVMENVFFNRQPLSRLRTVASRRMLRKTEELFAELGLDGIDPSAQVRELSVAARQFVAIAKVLADDPAVVVLDEATSALGPAEVEWLLTHAQTLAQRGKAVIFISHRLAEIEEVSNRVTVLRNGENAGSWAKGEFSSDDLITAMLGRQLDQLYPRRANPPRSRTLLGVRQLSAGRRLRSVDLTVREGEIVGVAGLEGQGQLELFLSLYGVIRSHGSVHIDGARHKIRSPREALRAGIGLALVPEDRKTEGILPTLSIRENLALPVLDELHSFGVLRRGTELGKVTQVIDDLRIGRGDPEQPVGDLSGGNQQKVVVGKFLLSHAKLLLLYDLTRGVDVGTKAEIFRMVQTLAEDGYGILFYSSDLAELANVPHRVVVLFDGRIVADLSGDEVSQQRLVAAMVGRRASSRDEVGADLHAPLRLEGEPSNTTEPWSDDRGSLPGRRAWRHGRVGDLR